MIYIFLFILGLIFGSFLNALVWRVKNNISLWGRSMCLSCKTQLRWYDNVPLLSFFILKGRCRNCKAKISWQYPLVEFTTGILFVLPILILPNNLDSLIKLPGILLITFFLIFIFVYDYKYQEIPDFATLPLTGWLFFVSFINGSSFVKEALIGMLIGAGFFLLQYVISKGRWIGGGDIRLGLLMGVILGWPNILLGLGLAYVIGAIFSVFLLSSKKKKLTSEIPFGTFLTAATFIAMFWGDKIVGWYVGLL